ncbi:type II secretion system F family protein [Pedobacter sp. LMG 31464]|uniref:General secretion pathway protein F n=1 Tax=Pedobacter planticolens TaxID=2679964 RepID=A0A923DY15_9SPHI|nr:type II secretion system F family protein [Pedobacter planticolens]MBB2144007.1 type II secretion system F family protein [Pedobacter planticolens]
MPSIDISAYQTKKKPSNKQDTTKSIFELFNTDIRFGDNYQLPDKKKVAFYSELSTLIKSGIDIKTSLDLVSESFEKEADKILFNQIKNQVIEGQSLSETLEKTNKFSPYEYYSIRIGEETGRSAEILQELFLYFKRKIAQKRKITSAITYPIIVLSTSFGAIFFMVKFVVPMFGDVFIRFGGKLPYLTQLIINISEGFDHYFYFGLILLLLAAIFYFTQRSTARFKKQAALLTLKIPIIGSIVQKVYLARFANTMRLLVGTDTPLLQSLTLVKQMINFYPIVFSLQQAETDIMHGKSLSVSLGQHTFYPSKFIQLIRIAEEVNQLEHFFEQLSNQYTEEVEYQTNAIGSLLEPLIIIVLGLVVGVILIAMYLPMFQMSNSF